VVLHKRSVLQSISNPRISVVGNQGDQRRNL